MNFKKNGGFTLVELIVVIAILGLLAGIAVPQYSQYVEKAQIAADNQNLNMLHNVFVVACVENDTDPESITLTAANLKWSEDTKTFSGLTGTPSARDGEDNPIVKSFNTYMGDPIQFKSKDMTAEKLIEGIEDGVGVVTVTYNGKQISISKEAVEILKNSTFGTAIGGKALLEEISYLTDLAGNGFDTTALFSNEAFMRSFASYLGVKNADTLVYDSTGENSPLSDAIDEVFAKYDSVEGFDGEKVMTNAMVYYAAEKTAEMDTTEITNLLTGGNIYGNLASDQGTKLAQASMAYGMYTAFVHSDYNKNGATSTQGNPMDAIQTISGNGTHSENFNEYIKSEQGQNDVKAYLSAMDVINDSTGTEATADVLINGFDDPELVKLLTDVIGK